MNNGRRQIYTTQVLRNLKMLPHHNCGAGKHYDKNVLCDVDGYRYVDRKQHYRNVRDEYVDDVCVDAKFCSYCLFQNEHRNICDEN
jgi:hypothetical protein